MSETKRITVSSAEEILGAYFPVLDHGHVALIDYMGGDDSIERAARTSYRYSDRTKSDQRHLLRFLRRGRHTSPSEMAELVFHCSMPIFVARQWVRHRTASLNEVSGRYAMMPMVFYMPSQEHFAAQSRTNKQGRDDVALTNELYLEAVDRWNAGRRQAKEHYEDMAAEDVAREIARIDLPLSTYTSWYWKIDLHNLLHFLSLRCNSHAQYEIRVYADIIAGVVKRLAPLSFEAWVDYDLLGVRMSRMEMNIIRAMATGLPLNLAMDSVNCEMSPREIAEFRLKIERPRAIPSFELDLNTAESAEFFENKYRAALPVVDRNET